MEERREKRWETTWRCHQNAGIGALGIQQPVILCFPDQIFIVHYSIILYSLLPSFGLLFFYGIHIFYVFTFFFLFFSSILLYGIILLRLMKWKLAKKPLESKRSKSRLFYLSTLFSLHKAVTHSWSFLFTHLLSYKCSFIRNGLQIKSKLFGRWNEDEGTVAGLS